MPKINVAMREKSERIQYRQKCRHYNMGACIARTQDASNIGWTCELVECDGKCLRMKRYDKKIAKAKELASLEKQSN